MKQVRRADCAESSYEHCEKALNELLRRDRISPDDIISIVEFKVDPPIPIHEGGTATCGMAVWYKVDVK